MPVHGRGMGAASKGGGCVAKGSSKGKGMKEKYPKEKMVKVKKMMGGGMAKAYQKGGSACK